MGKSSSPTRQKRSIDRRLVLPAIDGPGMSSSGIAGGRMVPVVRVNTQNYPAIDELVRLHEHFPDGDVSSFWGTARGDNRRVILSLKFHRPSKTEFAISFSVPDQHVLIDLAIQSKAIYIEPLIAGKKGVENLDNPRIFIQVPASSFEDVWYPIYEKFIIKKLREGGYSRSEAPQKAKQLIRKWRSSMSNLTFPLNHGFSDLR